jgi:hydrogenase maturation protein HypF
VAADVRRIELNVSGVVQGVGFRPFVYELATELKLVGWVINTTDGVTAQVQGSIDATEAFVRRLRSDAPPLAFIVDLSHRDKPVEDTSSFEIRPSQGSQSRTALLPPDVCICDDCARELRDPCDRRYRYPFINCTNCGPRYTIIDDVPYDRNKTSMAGFRMCEDCQREYEDPRDRRFHAQPNACFACGPRVWVTDPAGVYLEVADPFEHVGKLLRDGKIVGIKGLGGFHLAVDATNAAAVERLRARKGREAKPLAVMSRDLEAVARLAIIGEDARAVLTSPHRPIVLLPVLDSAPIADAVAPGNPNLGVMLPYTPLHMLLLDAGPPALVMTSGNVSEEPIAVDNHEAVQRLGALADAFLMHDRDILVRNDDSVLRPMSHGLTFLRRSRGYVPLPVMLQADGPRVLGVGGELKNTICVTRGRMAFVSQHIGDQANEAAFDSFVDTVQRLQRIVDARPERIAVDMHPDYATTRWAEAQQLPVVRVQHHHAHVASCLAENREAAQVLGLALDGTGYGPDGAIWGCELLVADQRAFHRVGHLGYVRQPGGDKAARQAWRMAMSHVMNAFGDDWEKHCPEAILRMDEHGTIRHLIALGTHAPRTSSTGRLFDAVAALCGLHLESQFEAQAAMGLEMAAGASSDGELWPVVIDSADELILDPSLFIRPVVQNLAEGVGVTTVAMRFHRTLAEALVRWCVMARERTGLTTVAASGGSMQNRLLAEVLVGRLGEEGFRVLVNRQVPPNDGGLALGQAVVGRHA